MGSATWPTGAWPSGPMVWPPRPEPSVPPSSGLVAWFRSDSLITLASTKVSAWGDKLGGAFSAVQATDARRPVYTASLINEYPAVTFSGAANQSLIDAVNSIYTNNQSRTVYVICRPNPTDGVSSHVPIAFRLTGNLAWYQGLIGTNYIMASGGGGLASVASPTVITDHVPIIAKWTSNGTNVTYDINQSAQTVTSPGVAGGDTGNAGFSIGNRASADHPYYGDIVEILCYNTVHAPAGVEEVAVYAYARSRYRFVANSARATVFCIGDSLTLGAGSATTLAEGGWRLRLQNLFPNLLETGHLTGPYSYKHSGITGQTSATILARTAANYTTAGGDIALIHAGTNDSAPPQGAEVPAATTCQNVVDMVTAIHAINPACKVIVALIIGCPTTGTNAAARNALYASQRSLISAALTGVANTSIATMPALTNAQFLDEFHPTSAGYDRMAIEGWKPALVALGY